MSRPRDTVQPVADAAAVSDHPAVVRASATIAESYGRQAEGELLQLLVDLRQRSNELGVEQLGRALQAAARVGESIARLERAGTERQACTATRERERLALAHAERERDEALGRLLVRETGDAVAVTAAAAAVGAVDAARAQRLARLGPMGALGVGVGVDVSVDSLVRDGGGPPPPALLGVEAPPPEAVVDSLPSDGGCPVGLVSEATGLDGSAGVVVAGEEAVFGVGEML